ncbi:MAG: hypothetical protein ACLR48_10360 [Ruminococcus sp.]|jgi:hypothetical protein|uniref:Uncharacterized protein n=1 Tax=Lachnospira intestinalis TaxID=3133158 RepID=A0ABV1H1N5_9FIRM|nr:MAG: hypothetical protein [Bacteriophage sp.]DAF18743.1 MAG TPA: hypothetical protein [Caudoviricetes sp.]DAM78328.1 MAG TPA: hypothetical protein [Caudoviricetes sp.]
MDIMRMHDMIEKLSECAKCEIDKGIENIDPCEMGQVTDMMKDLAEAMYYRTLMKSMEESSADETMEMFERLGDGRRFYDNYRYSNGRFAPKGRGTRRGYDEPPYFHMTPEMYRGMEHDRDIDRNYGRMYYTEPATSGMNMTESGYDKAKRHYTETKEMHKANTAEDKEHKMKSLENYMKELSGDITELLTDMTAEERTMLKSKLSTLVSKM